MVDLRSTPAAAVSALPILPAVPAWWRHEPTLLRFVTDLLAAELAQARPGRPAPPPPWAPGLDLVRDMGADSLELLGMGTALAEALRLHGGRAAADAAGAAARVDAGIGAADRMLARTGLGDWIAAARAALEDSIGGSAGRGDAGAITFRTSGSAGTPRRCTHRLATLLQETRELARLLPGRRRILSAVPAHHIYGFLFTVLLPRVLGIDEVIDLRGATPAALASMARPGDLVVAHPGWWEAVARLAPSLAPDIIGVSSGAPCPDEVAEALRQAGLRLLQVYGSSETAGVGWRERADAPFTLFPYWTRIDDASELARRLPDGGEARYPLQDTLAWDDARGFRPAGRIDQAVQVGGVNVFPAYVADVLRMHPAVRDAAVRLMRPDEGRRLKAFVVPRPDHEGGELLATQLAEWMAARLNTPECPAAYTFGARLPRQASGKPGDWIIDSL